MPADTLKTGEDMALHPILKVMAALCFKLHAKLAKLARLA